jgi:hypothetical protein
MSQQGARVVSSPPATTATATTAATSEQDRRLREEQKRTEAAQSGQAVYTVLKELSAGRPPRTTDLARAIDRLNLMLETEERAPSATTTLDDSGRRVLSNTRNVLEQSKNILETRSADDSIQTFLYHSVMAPKDVSSALSGVDDQTRQKWTETREALRAIGFHGRKVILLLARSPEFRESINTLMSIASRLLGKPELRQELSQIVSASAATTTAAAPSAPPPPPAPTPIPTSVGETHPPRAIETTTTVRVMAPPESATTMAPHLVPPVPSPSRAVLPPFKSSVAPGASLLPPAPVVPGGAPVGVRAPCLSHLSVFAR